MIATLDEFKVSDPQNSSIAKLPIIPILLHQASQPDGLTLQHIAGLLNTRIRTYSAITSTPEQPNSEGSHHRSVQDLHHEIQVLACLYQSKFANHDSR